MKILKPPPFYSGNMKGILVVKIKNGTSDLLPKRYSRQAVPFFDCHSKTPGRAGGDTR